MSKSTAIRRASLGCNSGVVKDPPAQMKCFSAKSANTSSAVPGSRSGPGSTNTCTAPLDWHETWTTTSKNRLSPAAVWVFLICTMTPSMVLLLGSMTQSTSSIRAFAPSTRTGPELSGSMLRTNGSTAAPPPTNASTMIAETASMFRFNNIPVTHCPLSSI